MKAAIKRQADLRRAVYILQNEPYKNLKAFCDKNEITPVEIHNKMMELNAFEEEIQKLIKGNKK